MRVLICPDKFKGSMSAAQVADAFCEGWLRVFPQAEIDKLPVADGGEGTAEIFLWAGGGVWRTADCTDALGRPMCGRYAWLARDKTAVIDMSEASGLWRIRPDERDPEKASTYGTGLLAADAVRAGARRLVIGLGGSATNDGGAGMAAAMGWRLLGADGLDVAPCPEGLTGIEMVVPPEVASDCIVEGLCDVTNPLLGENGASHIYGPQKGAIDTQKLDAVLARLADVSTRSLGRDSRAVPGAGAAGGLGFGLLTFFGASLKPGIRAIAELLGLEERLAAVDYVVTGEGCLDGQSEAGKAPWVIAQMARACGKPVIAVAGKLAGGGSQFDACIALADGPLSLEESCQRGPELAANAAERAARFVKIGRRDF